MATTFKTQKCIYNSGTYMVVELPEAASQTFKANEFVELNANSQINIVATDDVLTVGIALSDASGTTNTKIPVLLATNDTVFEITVHGTADPTFAASDLNKKLGLYVADSRSYADVDTDDADFFCLLTTKLDFDSAINIAGDDLVRALVMVLPEVYQFGDAAESA